MLLMQQTSHSNHEIYIFTLHKQNSPNLLCTAAAPLHSCTAPVSGGSGAEPDRGCLLGWVGFLFPPRSDLCSNAVMKSTCRHAEGKLTFKEKQRQELPHLLRQKSTARHLHPRAFCINNWQRPEIFGAGTGSQGTQEQQRGCRDGYEAPCRALSPHPASPTMAH